MAQVAKAKGYNSVFDLLKTIEGDPYKLQNHNPVENHIELQSNNVVGFASTQLKNDVAVLDEQSENKVKKFKSMKKDKEQCKSKNDVEEHRETSEITIDKLYKKLLVSTLSKEDN